MGQDWHFSIQVVPKKGNEKIVENVLLSLNDKYNTQDCFKRSNIEFAEKKTLSLNIYAGYGFQDFLFNELKKELSPISEKIDIRIWTGDYPNQHIEISKGKLKTLGI